MVIDSRQDIPNPESIFHPQPFILVHFYLEVQNRPMAEMRHGQVRGPSAAMSRKPALSPSYIDKGGDDDIGDAYKGDANLSPTS
jgi:hypothetical protein